MQLNKVVNFHKALADATRLKMLILLAEGERNGQELAEKLGVTPATVTFHAAKLREAALINERRDKNAIYFKLDDYFMKSYFAASEALINRGANKGETNRMNDEEFGRTRDNVLKNFFAADGKLKSIPAQLKKKLIVLEHIAARLEIGRRYSEKELNEFIKTYHEDFATIRREFIMHQFMYREREVYELNPRELWARWEQLS
ncbi:metalloregulator ArsR/SmtB family transcription factor [Cohnella suwonensis]|uniref:Metalloregulator ArsR/SmtB family transcription factor n=1 Tax=Cohnella suwonensis TaxID=696072 RepID=A0ABW0M233_9BACL